MRKTVYLLYIIMFALYSCKFESEGIFTDDTTEEYERYDYYVDEYGNEGIVAYTLGLKNSRGSKYIMVISSDEAYLPWGIMGENIYKSDTITDMGFRDSSFGIAMHQLMKSYGIEKFPAQAWCDAKNKNEKYPRAGSWHLPSFYEYQLIFGNTGTRVSSLNQALISIGGTPFNTANFYWTCVEDFDDYIHINNVESDYDKENRAVIASPTNSIIAYKDRWLKKNKYYVRAIKYVYYEYR